MITEDCMNRVLPVVADSWDDLRESDVFRLLSSIHYETREGLRAAGCVVIEKRPDLESEVQNVVDEIRLTLDWVEDNRGRLDHLCTNCGAELAVTGRCSDGCDDRQTLSQFV